ncbi:MAG: PVC-type heme-binding CxxCH protein [Planctomycetota bacterium]
MPLTICRTAVLLLFVGWASLSLAGPPVSPTEPLTPTEQKAKFKLPAGFEIQLVASEPDIQKPMNLAFDARGRLWVSHSIEYPFAAADSEKARDGLTVLEGIGPDGKAAKATKFAEGLNIPIGVLPLPSGNEVIVWSIPNIWKLTDTDNDGKADKREILYGPFDFADTHGNQNAFRLAPDGWVYACHGFRNASKVKLRGEGDVVLEMTSGNTYRFKPDGSAIEQMSWGQVNPFGQAIDPLGNRFTADCHSKPLTLIVRGGHYDSFGKPHDGLGFVPLTTGNDHGSTGIAAVAIYAADQFPREYHGNIFVGNVVTNIIHRDVIQWRGSSPWVEKPEDFVTCDDWWFHPVDLQLGPDGALYISDFYNSIIGHYEVDLKHPRRDRHRGRVWRVVWMGERDKETRGQGDRETLTDLTEKSVQELVVLLGDANQTVRQLALGQLVERASKGRRTAARAGIVIEALQEASKLPNVDLKPLVANQTAGPLFVDRLTNQRAMATWGLLQLGRLDDETARRLSGDPSSVVRVHLVKAITERFEWHDGAAPIVRSLLADADPFVVRAAAEALGVRLDADNIRPLLHAWKAAPKADVQLIHTIRIALRNQLRGASAIEQLATIKLSEEELTRLIDIALAVPNETAAWFTFDFVRGREVSPELMSQCLMHVAQHVGGARLDDVAKFVQTKYSADATKQVSLFQSLFSGLTRRGQRLSSESELGKWGASLAVKMLDPKSRPAPAWVNVPVESAPFSLQASPWGVRPRGSADGVKGGLFFDSISNGEKLTGVLRSAPFAVPDKLSFWLCGHNGLPTTKPAPVNHIRLKLVESGEVIAQQIPPRNDVAQKIEWNLTKWAGQRGVIEIVDADTGDAYAWLGAGRFEPAVVENPSPGFAFGDGSLALALQVADQMRLVGQFDHVLGVLGDAQSAPTVRAVAATAAMSLDRPRALTALASLMTSAAEPVALRVALAQQLGPVDADSARTALGTALTTAPASLQQPVALALATTRPGADSLLNLVATGKASSRLLQDKPVVDRLKGTGLPELDARLSDLTKDLPAPDERLRQQIAKFSASQSTTTTSLETGAAMFKKVCANCHRIGSEGAKFGPQLDGIGQRGLERLLEDILDPNRNIDAAFRATTISTNQGQVITGLKLREEGAAVILADAQGKEVRINNADIDESRVTALSPMPSNVVEQIGEQNLPHLIAFLLQQRQPVRERQP